MGYKPLHTGILIPIYRLPRIGYLVMYRISYRYLRYLYRPVFEVRFTSIGYISLSVIYYI